VPAGLQLLRTPIALSKTKKIAAEGKEISDVNVGRYSLRETDTDKSL